MNNDALKNNARYVSFNILYDVFFNKVLLNKAIDFYYDKNHDLTDENKKFIKRDVTGVIEKLDDIDFVISKFVKYKINKINRDVLVLLRIGIYEILFMDKVPAYASVNELVNIIKDNKNHKFASFLNAVLRNVDRNKEDLKNNFLNNFQSVKRCYFRIYNNREKDVIEELDRKNIYYEKYDGSLDYKYAKVYFTKSYKEITDLNIFKDGGILIEDASSIYMTDKLADFIKEREKIIKEKNSPEIIPMMKLLDTCASPGGKILGLIDLIYDDYVYFYAEARDISKEKINKICENLDRLKVMDLNLNIKDASVYDVLEYEKYDIVICDVPCTGLGVIDKKPDIKLNYSDERRDKLTIIQGRILDVSKNYVKKGGILAYSTCTETKEENENITNAFINKNSNFIKIFEKKIIRGDSSNSDGFYMCFFEKK